MFLLLLVSTFFAAAFFTAENLVPTIVGFLVSIGLTQWLKNQTGAYGAGAMVLAMVISVVIATGAVLITMFVSGNFSWDSIPQSALQIFALATIAYKLFMADPVDTE